MQMPFCPLLTILSLLSINPLALANDQEIDEILVQGSANKGYLANEESSLLKNGSLIEDSPINIQVISSAVMAEQDVKNLQDALRNVSGVQANFTMGGAYERFTIRGFSQSIASYRNGVLLPVSRFHRANVEQIEVLKGPAALELGMSDPGGAINITTRRPTKEAQYSFTQSVGSLGEFGSIINSSGKLGTDKLQYRLDASWEQTDGYRDITDSTEKFIAPALWFQLNDSTQIKFNLELSNSEYTYDQGLHAWQDELVDLPVERAYGQKNALQEYDNQTVELIVEHQFNETFSMTAGYVQANAETYFRSIYATGNPSPGNTIVNRSAWFGPEETTTNSAWISFNKSFNTGNIRHKLSAGYQTNSYDYDGSASITLIEQIDILTYSSGDSSINVAAFDALPRTDFIHIQDDEFNGFYIQDQIYFSDQAILLVGLRHDKSKSDFYDYYGPGGPWITENNVNSSATTGRLGFIYKTENVSPFISYSTSYGPGFNYLPSNVYQPEEAEQLEAGVKINAFDNRAQFTLSVYNILKSNIPTPDPNIPNRTVTIGEAESGGIELDIIGALSDSWSIIANMALMDTEVTKDYSGLEGNELPNAPKQQVGTWLRFAPGNFAIGGGVSYVSERYGIANNSYRDDAFTRIDLFASYDFMVASFPATARLLLNNVSDEVYFNMRSRWSNMPSEPANAVASFNINF